MIHGFIFNLNEIHLYCFVIIVSVAAHRHYGNGKNACGFYMEHGFEELRILGRVRIYFEERFNCSFFLKS